MQISFCSVSFYTFKSVLHWEKVFNLKSPIYLFFVVVVAILKKSLLNPRSWRCFPVFSPKDFIIIHVFADYFGMMCKIVWCSFCYAYGFWIFPLSFVEKIIFSIVICLWAYLCSSISGFWILFHWSMCLFLLQYHTALVTVAAKNSSIQIVSEFRKWNFPVHFTKATKPWYHLLHKQILHNLKYECRWALNKISKSNFKNSVIHHYVRG